MNPGPFTVKLNKGAEMRCFITVGYVAVYVPLFDCEGTQRTIDFPRVGKRLYGSPKLHYTAKTFIECARIAARKALAIA